MIDVSIIIPVYNSEKYLKKCIDSLLSQTHNNIEIIIINDGSKDNSEKIIKGYKDNRIKYVSKENEGIGKTRNKGIKISKGNYIMFIDSDDYIDKDCIKDMLDYAKKTDSDLVVSDFYKDYDGKLEKIEIPNFESSTLENNPELLNIINMGPCNKIYKRSLIDKIKFDEEYKYEDIIFVCKALINAKKISKINKALSYYVIHSNSETTTRDETILDIIKVNKQLKKLFYSGKTKDSFIDFSVMMITDYAAQTRYICDRKLRKDFIDKAYDYLYELDPKWYKRDRFKKINIFKRIIKSNRKFLLLYTDLVGYKYRINS